MAETELWFRTPAATWNEALPLGNGRMGAMVFGDPARSRYQMNDATGWSGSPASESAAPNLPASEAGEVLAEARAAVARGDYVASDTALKRLQHRYSQTFLPFADLVLAPAMPSPFTAYRRSLDLATATHLVEVESRGFRVTERAFISHRYGVLVVELTAEDPQGLNLDVRLSTPLRVVDTEVVADLDDDFHADLALLVKLPADVAPSHDDVPEQMRYDDDPTASLQGAVVARVVHDGSGRGGTVRGARRVTVFVATETTFTGLAETPVGTAADAYQRAAQRIAKAVDAGAANIHHHHVRDHGELFDRVRIETGGSSALSTDRRLTSASGSVLSSDPGLVALLFNFGRYLLISSSREGSVPANLQGIWNDSIQPVWSSNYTTNINLQMNYWMAEVAALPECLPPLFDLIDALTRTGTRTARELYGAAGWVAHHNTDIWAYSRPVGLGTHDPKWAFWPLAPAWLVRHLWERIEHGAPDSFVADRAWHPIRGAAEFYLDWLVEEPDGSLGTAPSTSPENQFTAADGVTASSARSSTSDLVAIADVFDMLVGVAERLGRESDEVVVRAIEARRRIAGPRISAQGWVQEWADDFGLADPHHRHLSHLYFVHPGNQPYDDRMAEAVSRTLDVRGDESTGWSLTWKVLMRARLRQPERVSDLLALVYRDMEIDRGPWVGGLYPNLFSAHPPFSIDGNLGFVAALAECLVQSHTGIVELLPALPAELADGSVEGLIVRGGARLDLAWRDGALIEATLGAPDVVSARPYRLSYRGVVVLAVPSVGESVRVPVERFAVQPLGSLA